MNRLPIILFFIICVTETISNDPYHNKDDGINRMVNEKTCKSGIDNRVYQDSKNYFKGAVKEARYGRSGLCQINATCFHFDYLASFFIRKPKKSKRRMTSNAPSEPIPISENSTISFDSTVLLSVDNGKSVCSASLINNTKNDGRKLILTAAHCLTSDKRYNTHYTVLFNYEHATCQPGQSEPKPYIARGINVLLNDEHTDTAIVELIGEIPPGSQIQYAGWTRETEVPKNAVSIHHPWGDVKMFAATRGQHLSLNEDAWGRIVLDVKYWDRGVVENGSSGSPLFGEDGLIRGHLIGGQGTCETNAHIGFLDERKRSRRTMRDTKGKKLVPDMFRAFFNAWDILPEMRMILDPIGKRPMKLEALII